MEVIRHTHGQMQIRNHIFVTKSYGKGSLANPEVKSFRIYTSRLFSNGLNIQFTGIMHFYSSPSVSML